MIFSPWLISANNADLSLVGSSARFDKSPSGRTGGGGGIAAGGGGGGAPPALDHSNPVVWCFFTKSWSSTRACIHAFTQSTCLRSLKETNEQLMDCQQDKLRDSIQT